MQNGPPASKTKIMTPHRETPRRQQAGPGGISARDLSTCRQASRGRYNILDAIDIFRKPGSPPARTVWPEIKASLFSREQDDRLGMELFTDKGPPPRPRLMPVGPLGLVAVIADFLTGSGKPPEDPPSPVPLPSAPKRKPRASAVSKLLEPSVPPRTATPPSGPKQKARDRKKTEEKLLRVQQKYRILKERWRETVEALETEAADLMRRVTSLQADKKSWTSHVADLLDLHGEDRDTFMHLVATGSATGSETRILADSACLS